MYYFPVNLVALSMSNFAVSVHILRNHFRGVGVQGHDYLDYAGGGIQNWEIDYVIYAVHIMRAP